MADGVKVYRLAEVMKHNGEGDAWMIIHNKIYDVSKWDNHPGGFLIQQGYGRDASALYESTHPESARAVMNKFYIGDLHAEDQTDKYTWDSPFYKTLKQRINDWFKENKVTNRQDHPELYIKMATVTICFPIFWYLALTSSSMILRYVYGTIASIFVAHFGISVMHDGCHGAFSRNPIVCALAAYYLDLLGASSFVWKHQHNIGHHSHTNTPQDPDAITAHPMIRVSPHREWKPWMQFQQFYAWILFCFVALRWMQKDIEVVFEGLYEPNIPLMKMDKTQRMVFWGGKAWFVFLFILTPVFAFGLVEGLIFFMWAQILVSLQFALQFTVNHYENPCVFPSDKFPISDWAQLQVETTSNYGAGQRIWELWSGGLNYQIEHHLFPAISHPYYKHLSPIVQKTCKEYGVRYQNYPNFFEAVHGVYEHLKRWGTKPTSMKN